jgi:CheY-like chemotaxis protein
MVVDLDAEDVAARGAGRPGRYVRLTVADSGKGMDEQTRERIFEPFFTTKEMGKGTGLGLATVYGIIKQHQGFIDVESASGAGTSFHLYFPSAGTGSELPIAPDTQAPPGGNETVLVAEDDDIIRSLVRSVLKEFGYQVIEAKDGEEAVRIFREDRGRIDLLLFDVIMPKKNGRAALDEIRAMDPRAKVLFMSGYSGDMISKEGILEKGMSFVPKPVSPSTLLRKVREVLDRKD